MFGPDSAKHGWHGQSFVYERTRINKVLLDPRKRKAHWHCNWQGEAKDSDSSDDSEGGFLDDKGVSHDIHENSEAHVAGMDRIERFLR